MIAVFHGTDLLTFEISKLSDIFVGAHDTEALVSHAEQMVAASGIDVADQLPELLVIDFFPAVIERIERTWEIKYGQIMHKGNLWCSVLYDKWNIAVGTRLEQITVAAERTVCIDLYFHASVA